MSNIDVDECVIWRASEFCWWRLNSIIIIVIIQMYFSTSADSATRTLGVNQFWANDLR